MSRKEIFYKDGKTLAAILLVDQRRKAHYRILVTSGYRFGGANLRGILDAVRSADLPLTLSQWVKVLRTEGQLDE